MRISSSAFYRFASDNILRQQTEIAKMQSQIASGSSLTRPSDDPVQAARKIDLQHEQSQLTQYNRNINIAREKLQHEESVIDNSTNLVLRAKELALVASNSATSSDDYPAIKTELKHLLEDLLSQSNATDYQGKYIFAGAKSETMPFSGQQHHTYAGDEIPLQIQIGQQLLMPTSHSGKAVFVDIDSTDSSHRITNSGTNTGNVSAVLTNSSIDDSIKNLELRLEFDSPNQYSIIDVTSGTALVSNEPLPTSNRIEFQGLQIKLNGTPETGDTLNLTPAATQDAFTTFNSFIDLLDMDPQTAGDDGYFRQELNNIIGALDETHSHLVSHRANIGNRLSTLDTVENENEAIRYNLTTTLANIQDVDLVSAISKIEQQSTALQALQATIQRVESLSLFNLR